MVWFNRFNVSMGRGLQTPTIGGANTSELDVYDAREQRVPWPVPVVRALQQAEMIFTVPKNRYDLMDKFVENDAELEAGIDIKASMVRKAYRGLRLRVGKDITPEEDVMIEFLKSLDQWLNLKRKYYIVAKKILRYGDWIYVKEIKGGIPRLRTLPIKYMSVVDNITQLENVDIQVFNGNYYVLNEYKEEKRKIFHRSRILHFTYEKEGAEVYDQYGRYTFEVFSPSPLLPLSQYILWKHNIIINDIMQRHKMIPREIHAVNTLGINPQTVGDPGDLYDTRVAKAEAEIKRILKAYETSIAYTGADRGYITQAEAVDISILEPKSTTYLKPNEIIDQINGAYAKRLGIPISELSSLKTESYAGAVIKTSFSTIRTLDLAELIGDKLLEYIREYIIKTYPAYAYMVENIYMDIDLVMDQEEERRFRIASLMAQMEDIFTNTEIRLVCGYEKLTVEQQKEIDEMLDRRAKFQAKTTIPGRTPANTASQQVQRRSSDVSGFPDTPRQREKEQVGLSLT